jgi:hypothetical protein
MPHALAGLASGQPDRGIIYRVRVCTLAFNNPSSCRVESGRIKKGSQRRLFYFCTWQTSKAFYLVKLIWRLSRSGFVREAVTSLVNGCFGSAPEIRSPSSKGGGNTGHSKLSGPRD